MTSNLYYLFVNLGCIIVPFLFSFHPRLNFYKKWKVFIAGAVAMMAVFIPWDIYFTHIGVWGFNPNYLIGYYIGGIPIEEWLFFICIPYACLFTYHCFKILIKEEPTPYLMKPLLWLSMIGSLVIAAIYHDRLYTFTSHLFCGIFLMVHLLILKSRYLNRFMFMYLVILIPFIATNGILTGLDFWKYDLLNLDPQSVNDQIVWYDNSENMGVRLFSIPIDDISYGLTMLLLVTTIYEAFSAKKKASA